MLIINTLRACFFINALLCIQIQKLCAIISAYVYSVVKKGGKQI